MAKVRQLTAIAMMSLGALMLPATAQDSMFLNQFNDSAEFLQSYVGNVALGAVATHQAERVAAGNAAAPALAPDALKFGRDAAISQQVRANFAQNLIAADPARQAAIEAALHSDWLAGYASDIARPNGLEPDNLADAYTAYVIASWALVQGAVTLPPQGISAVRDAMRAALARSPALQQLSGPDKQALGEELIYNTVLMMANRVALHNQPDTALSARAAQHYARQFEAAGLDLTRLQLTDAGLVSRP